MVRVPACHAGGREFKSRRARISPYQRVVRHGALRIPPHQIAAEVHLSVDAVKAHMRHLFERFELGALPQNEKRMRLVAIVLGSGLLARHDF